MRRIDRKFLSTILCIAVISVLTLSIAYAALSDTLTISGTGVVTASNWDITLNNSTANSNTVTGSATYTKPVVSGTTISYSVGLTKPSDSVTLYFDVANQGDLVGEISAITTATPTCTSETGNAQDASLVCNNLEISLQYSDGSSVQVGDIVNTDGKVCANNSSYWKSTTPSIKVIVKLKDSMTSLPTSKVTITNIRHDILYAQTEKTCSDESSCFVAGTKIAVENGYKNIEDIKVGEYVYSYNLDTNKKELKKVLETFIHQKDEIYTLKVNNQLIYTTEEHPFYVINKGWINTEKLNFDDKLLSIKTGPTNIQNISKRKNKTYVYNFEVEDNHNYLITKEDLLVHNKTFGGGGGN